MKLFHPHLIITCTIARLTKDMYVTIRWLKKKRPIEFEARSGILEKFFSRYLAMKSSIPLYNDVQFNGFSLGRFSLE